MDIVIGEGSSIFQLLSSEDKSLLIRWDTFFVLDLGLDILNSVCWLNIEGNSFACKSFDENLHFCFGCKVSFFIYLIIIQITSLKYNNKMVKKVRVGT